MTPEEWRNNDLFGTIGHLGLASQGKKELASIDAAVVVLVRKIEEGTHGSSERRRANTRPQAGTDTLGRLVLLTLESEGLVRGPRRSEVILRCLTESAAGTVEIRLL